MSVVFEKRIEQVKERYSEILDKLKTSRVFTIKAEDFDLSHGDQIEIIEGCDDYYGMHLSKYECLQLANLFKELSELAPEHSSN